MVKTIKLTWTNLRLKKWMMLQLREIMNKNWFHLLIVLDLQQKKIPFKNFFFFFLISEEKYATQQNTYLSKININELTDTLLENTEFISYFNSVVDTFCVDNFDDNTRERLFLTCPAYIYNSIVFISSRCCFQA